MAGYGPDYNVHMAKTFNGISTQIVLINGQHECGIVIMHTCGQNCGSRAKWRDRLSKV